MQLCTLKSIKILIYLQFEPGLTSAARYLAERAHL